MYMMNKTKSLKSQEAINKCLEEIDETFQNGFLEVMKKLEVKLGSGTEYFDEEINMLRAKYRIYLKKDGKTISFVFHDSAHNYQEGNEPDLYSIMCCVGREGSDTTIEFEGFEGFCAEYGYDTDSIKAHSIYKKCEKQLKRIQSILDLKELETFPQ